MRNVIGRVVRSITEARGQIPNLVWSARAVGPLPEPLRFKMLCKTRTHIQKSVCICGHIYIRTQISSKILNAKKIELDAVPGVAGY